MSEPTAADFGFMARALVLANEGLYSADPNPRVGCVLVKDGTIVGEGFHARPGEGHAEANALAAAGGAAKGATAYVTLEPCNHQGRTPPCSEALIAAGVSRLVYATQDPNPAVAGGGAKRLEAAGIGTASGCLAAEARALNPGFFSRSERGRPFTRVKLASSLDGRTALANGQSQWLSCDAARADVQRLRARSSAVLTGASSARRDGARLTVRDASLALRGRVPLRVVMDPRLTLGADAPLLAEPGPVLVITGVDAPAAAAPLTARGAEVLNLGDAGARDVGAVLAELGRRGVNELLVEGGARLAGAFIQSGLVDEFILYLAPNLLGHDALPLAALPMLDDLGDRWSFRFKDVRQIGADLKLTLVPAERKES
jgi:diaminohydroxyphosphoribosylaminopyrimidine deaminase/5-amino-6-(5-phosphoribosylamino)uracil reductase